MEKERGEKKRSEKGTSENQTGESINLEIARAEYEELRRKVSEFDLLQDRLLRSAADFDNAKKRLAREREEFVKFALEDLMLALLPVLDNFQFALSHLSGDDEKTRTMRDGFLLIQKQLIQILTDRGLKPVEANVGQPFNAHVHEAVDNIFSADQPDGIILEEVQTGYELNGKLLRPAKVKISTKNQRFAEDKAEELT